MDAARSNMPRKLINASRVRKKCLRARLVHSITIYFAGSGAHGVVFTPTLLPLIGV